MSLWFFHSSILASITMLVTICRAPLLSLSAPHLLWMPVGQSMCWSTVHSACLKLCGWLCCMLPGVCNILHTVCPYCHLMPLTPLEHLIVAWRSECVREQEIDKSHTVASFVLIGFCVCVCVSFHVHMIANPICCRGTIRCPNRGQRFLKKLIY